jgi:hypothetical protein
MIIVNLFLINLYEKDFNSLCIGPDGLFYRHQVQKEIVKSKEDRNRIQSLL